VDFREALSEGLKEMGLVLPAGAEKQMAGYYGLLTAAAATMNLTGIREPAAVAEKHFLDALALLLRVSFRPGERLLDVGSGAGIPGIPIGIAVPETEVVLLEAVRRKVVFLEEVVARLSLRNIAVVWGRAEEYGRREGYREAFDWVVARAVAPLRELVEYALPFVRLGGRFVAYKGPKGEEEAKAAARAITVLGGVLQGVEEYRLPLREDRRCLVVVSKEGPTPLRYPRRAGVPRKKPL